MTAKAPGEAALLGQVFDVITKSSFGSDRDEERAADAASARREFEQRRGRVLEDEELWETWSASFVDAYLIERPLPAHDLPPAAMALAGEPAPERREAISAWLTSHRSLFEIRALGSGSVEVVDVIGGAEIAVTEKRTFHGVAVGDMIEARIIGFAGELHFGRAFVFHPTEARDAIAERAVRERKSGMPGTDILDLLARLRLRCERYRHVPTPKIYAEDSPR